MLNQRLQQKLLQKLSPQQIQMIKLLEVPTLQIEERIKQELEENPALAEGQEEDKRTEIPFSVGFSFHEHLESQLSLRDLTDKQKILGEYILGNIDEDGYLRRELINIVDDLAFLQNVETTESELEEVLLIIQDLEPAGVGARTLRECLLLQIEKRDTYQPSMKLAHKILNSHFDEFTKRHYDKIISRLGITEDELKSAIDEILKLNPKPGGVYSDPFNKTSQPIIPVSYTHLRAHETRHDLVC